MVLILLSILSIAPQSAAWSAGLGDVGAALQEAGKSPAPGMPSGGPAETKGSFLFGISDCKGTIKGSMNGYPLDLKVADDRITGSANGYSFNWTFSAGNIKGTANGYNLDLKIAGDRITGTAHGYSLKLMVSPGDIKGTANGYSLDLKIAEDRITGTANGYAFNLTVSPENIKGTASGYAANLKLDFKDSPPLPKETLETLIVVIAHH